MSFARICVSFTCSFIDSFAMCYNYFSKKSTNVKLSFIELDPQNFMRPLNISVYIHIWTHYIDYIHIRVYKHTLLFNIYQY